MNFATRVIATCALLGTMTASLLASEWRDFRGTGSDPQSVVPKDWSIAEGAGVAWSSKLPGRGVSGPVVINGRVIVTASDGPSRQRLSVSAYSEGTGELLWSRRFLATGRTFCHESSANAAPTPATDGQHVYAFFSSNELIAIDLDGNVQWIRCLALDHPGVGNDVGMASSPVVADGVVVVQAECLRNSFAIAVDSSTGETLWDLKRPANANWTTPLVLPSEESEPVVLLQSGEGLAAHRLHTGEVVWDYGLECRTIPSVTQIGNQIIAPSGGLTALQLVGDAEPEPIWRSNKLSPGSSTAVIDGDRVLVINRSGVAICGDLESGDLIWRRRLKGRFWATPVASGGRACIVNDQGKAWVLSMADGSVLTESDFAEPVLASPAVAGGALYVRSYETLWKIVQPDGLAGGGSAEGLVGTQLMAR